MYKLSEVTVETISYKARSSIAVFLNSQANCICSQMFQLHNVLMLITVIKYLKILLQLLCTVCNIGVHSMPQVCFKFILATLNLYCTFVELKGF